MLVARGARSAGRGSTVRVGGPGWRSIRSARSPVIGPDMDLGLTGRETSGDGRSMVGRIGGGDSRRLRCCCGEALQSAEAMSRPAKTVAAWNGGLRNLITPPLGSSGTQV